MCYAITVKYYDELTKEILTETSVCIANSNADAVKHANDYYGESNIEKITIEFLTDNSILRIPDFMIPVVKEKND